MKKIFILPIRDTEKRHMGKKNNPSTQKRSNMLTTCACTTAFANLRPNHASRDAMIHVLCLRRSSESLDSSATENPQGIC
jgi:hypothetical protein